jgi:hypothetical protein
MKQLKLGKANYILILHEKWLFISWTSGHASCTRRVFEDRKKMLCSQGAKLSHFLSADHRLTGILYRMQWDLVFHILYIMYGWESRYSVSLKEPTVSTKRLASGTGTSHTSLQHTLQEWQLYPCHIQTVQELVPHDEPARCAFCQWICNSQLKVLCLQFTDWINHALLGPRSSFKTDVWSDETPHWSSISLSTPRLPNTH